VSLLVGGSAAATPFVNINRHDHNSMAGGEVTYVDLDGSNDTTLLRFDLHGQYVDPGMGLGGYASVPIAFASGNNDSETALGNLEIGGIFVPKLNNPELRVILHGGLTLPTAPDEDNLGAAFVGVFAGYARVHDLYQVIPKGTTVRLGASPIYTSGQLVARLDAGVDVNLDSSDMDTADPAFHLNLGVGFYATPDAVVMAELSTLTIFDDNDGDDDNVANAVIGGRFYAGSLQPYVGLIIPLDDDISEFMNLGLTIGLDARI
jgi:hypothetical protein